MNVKIADRVKLAVTAVVSLIMVLALYVSRDHITDVAYRIGLTGYQAETLFALVDVVALIGKVLQLKYFAASTRKVGRRLMIGAGIASLVCNVASGWLSGGYGPAGYGVFVVVLFLVLENVLTKIKPAAAVTRAKNAATVKAAPRKRAPRAAYAKRATTSTTAKATPVSTATGA
jgi:uncharacterized membrane protein